LRLQLKLSKDYHLFIISQKKMNQLNIKKELSAIIVPILVLLFTSCSSSEGPEICIIHTNDTHSQIDGLYMDEQPIGGVIERASFLELMRQQDPQLIYLDAGDMVQGSPYFNIWNGMIEMKAMNLQELICSTFGNHEFDNGIDFLKNMLDYACFPIINCNYDVSGTPLEPYTRTSMVIERKGVRIGITGVTCDPNNLIFNRNWEGIKYINPVVAANAEAAKLRDEGCDLVVLLSHVGYYPNDTTGDRWIASKSTGIDMIIGGHTHTNIENGIVVKNAEGKPVMITQTGAKASPIGHINIKMKKNGRHKDGSDAFAVKEIHCKKLHTDLYDLHAYGRVMSDFISPYRDSLEQKMSTILGRCSHDLPRFRPESPLGNFASDVLRTMGSFCYGHPMDIGIMNVGGLRSDIYAGDLKLGDIYRVFPFENTLAIVELKGSQVEELVHQLEGKRLEAFSGITCTLKVEKGKTADGESFEKITASDIKVGGKPIDPEQIYYIATIDYLAEGNDGMQAMTKAVKYTNTGILLRNLMVGYIIEQNRLGKDIDAKIEGRIKVIE